MFKRSALGLLIAVLCTAGLAVPAHATTGPSGYLTMVGKSTYVVGTASLLWRDSDITVSGSLDNGIDITGTGGSSGMTYNLSLAAAPGQSLAVGQYDDAQRTSFREEGHPGIDLYGEGRGCGTVAGSFTVKDISADLSKVWITYKQYCEGLGAAPIFGEIKIGEPEDPELLVAPQSIDWPDVLDKGTSTVQVNLVNVGASTVDVSAASITSGSANFKVVSNPCATIAAGATCAVGVAFNPQSVADFTGTLTITDSTTAGTHAVALSGTGAHAPVKAAITFDKNSYAYGQTAKVTVTMGGSWTAPNLSIYKQVGTGSRILITTTGVDSQGQTTVSLPLKQSTTFSVDWTDGAEQGTTSRKVGVVPITLSLSRAHSIIGYNGTAHITATLAGKYPTRRVKFYRKAGTGARVLFATKYVGSTGKVSVDLKINRTTGFSAEWTDGVTKASAPSTTVQVRARVVAFMKGYYAKTGSYALYHAGNKIYVGATVTHAHPGLCVQFSLEVYSRGRWRLYATANCARQNSSGVALTYLTYSKGLRGHRLRFQAFWGGDSQNAGWVSQHVYGEWV